MTTLEKPKTSYRLGLAVAIFTVLFLVWAVGALGIIGDGGPPDLMYAGVLVVGVIGTAIARLQPRGMARALAAMVATVALIAVITFVTGLYDEEGSSALEILGLNGMYMALFGLSAWLFQRAAVSADPAA